MCLPPIKSLIITSKAESYTVKGSSLYYSNDLQGFTLIELVLTLMILATLSAIAAPSFIETLQNWEAKQIRSQLTNAFRTAKTHSYRQRQNTILCLADADYQCHKQAEDYLLIFTDTDNNHQYDKATNLIILQQPLQLDYGRLYLTAGGRHYIKFFSDSGLPRGHFGHIKYCSNARSTVNKFQISLNQQGNHRYKPYSLKQTGCPAASF